MGQKRVGMNNNPSHPGLIIREDVLPDLQLSVKDAAAQLGVSRVTLSRVINGRTGISADMALRLGKWVGNGAEIWVRMQGQHDLWQARKAGEPKVKKAKRPEVAQARTRGVVLTGQQNTRRAEQTKRLIA